jgi:hypothetical protein
MLNPGAINVSDFDSFSKAYEAYGAFDAIKAWTSDQTVQCALATTWLRYALPPLLGSVREEHRPLLGDPLDGRSFSETEVYKVHKTMRRILFVQAIQPGVRLEKKHLEDKNIRQMPRPPLNPEWNDGELFAALTTAPDQYSLTLANCEKLQEKKDLLLPLAALVAAALIKNNKGDEGLSFIKKRVGDPLPPWIQLQLAVAYLETDLPVPSEFDIEKLGQASRMRTLIDGIFSATTNFTEARKEALQSILDPSDGRRKRIRTGSLPPRPASPSEGSVAAPPLADASPQPSSPPSSVPPRRSWPIRALLFLFAPFLALFTWLFRKPATL